MPRKNLLCFGENFAFLKNASLFPNESVDLIYLDPPFNQLPTRLQRPRKLVSCNFNLSEADLSDILVSVAWGRI
jgi:16S rRNA G966 N2-methylase RsmD